ncbi:MAG: RnfABCDGE type electron transport complex subunit D [bacterium]
MSTSPHIHSQATVQAIMLQVLMALTPAILAHVWFFGTGVLIQIIWCSLLGLGYESMALVLRKRPVKKHLTDLSVVVAATLFALSAPPLLPWWTSMVAMFFVVIIAKHLYGGLGHNVFNPAMVGYVVVLIGFPAQMSLWIPPTGVHAGELIGPVDALSAIFLGHPPLGLSWDALTQATPLDLIRTETARNHMLSEVRSSPVFGDFGGVGWEWIANFYALGGIYLARKKIIPWQVPVAILVTVIVLTTPFFLMDNDVNPSPLQHIFSGGLMLGAFFIATDPVSSCQTPKGKWIFGIGIALIVLAIRRWGNYPDGVAFAILLMNIAAPLIDRYTRPAIYGEQK